MYTAIDNTAIVNLSKLTPNSGFYSGPYLDGHTVTNITTQTGTHAYLPCRVSGKKKILKYISSI